MNERWLGLCILSACLIFAGIVFLPFTAPLFAVGLYVGYLAYLEDVQ